MSPKAGTPNQNNKSMTRPIHKASTRAKKSSVSAADHEASARAGLCAAVMFASATDIPAVVAESLPDGEFCHLSDMISGMKKVERHLKNLDTGKGRAYTMVRVKEARDLTLTLILADTSIGLSKELDPTPVVEVEHRALKKAVEGVTRVVNELLTESMTFEEFRNKVDVLPDPHLVNKVLDLVGSKMVVVQSMAGPLDFNLGKVLVKEVMSGRQHVLDVSVISGFDEQAQAVGVEIRAIIDADRRLFTEGLRIRVRVHDDEHRLQILLAQLAKQSLQVGLSLPRVPFNLTSPSKSDLVCDLVELNVPEDTQSLRTLKQELLKQFSLDF